MSTSCAVDAEPSLGLNNDSFDSAVEALLSPLHQATTKEAISRSAARRAMTVQDMRAYWGRIRWTNKSSKESSEEPAQLFAAPSPPRVVHITGTKGKGSTACMCQAILQEHGFSTGLFTSPHLMDIRERIRWNGKPIHPNMFARAYWKIRRDLESYSGVNDDGLPLLPGYFRMLTLMAYYIFALLKVDVWIVEVGIGGRYDATNFIDDISSSVRSCGVALLDYDHTRILGNTLEQIAWEKGGIFGVDKVATHALSPRPSSVDRVNESNATQKEQMDQGELLSRDQREARHFFVLDSNTPGVQSVLQQCACNEGQGGSIQLVDSTGSDVLEALHSTPLGLAGEHQLGNANLAVNLCRAVVNDTSELPSCHNPRTLRALVNARWPARCQMVEKSGYRFFLDGAHTLQSLRATMEWFGSMATTTSRRILVFNCSHERDPVELLQLLVSTKFDKAIFAKADTARPSPVDLPSPLELLHANNIPVQPSLLVTATTNSSASYEPQSRSWQETLGSIWNHLCYTPQSDVEPDTVQCSIDSAQVLRELPTASAGPVEVLVTGSLYLVGSFLNALEWNEESSADSRMI